MEGGRAEVEGGGVGYTPEAHDENLQIHELGHGLQPEGADLAAVLVHESRIILELRGVLFEVQGGSGQNKIFPIIVMV